MAVGLFTLCPLLLHVLGLERSDLYGRIEIKRRSSYTDLSKSEARVLIISIQL